MTYYFHRFTRNETRLHTKILDMTTYLVRVLYSSNDAADIASIGTRHPSTDPMRCFETEIVFWFSGY
mgnify:FL=1